MRSRSVRTTALWLLGTAVCALAFFVVIAVDSAADLLDIASNGKHSVAEYTMLKASYWYQPIVTLSFRKSYPRVVTLVEIQNDPQDPRTEELVAARCTQREFLARLIRHLSEAHPAAIVIDKWYPSAGCPGIEGQRQTAALKEAIATVPPTTTVIVAAKDHSSEEVRSESSSLYRDFEATGASSSTLVLEDTVFSRAPAGRPTLALARLNRDSRKVPTSWNAFPDRATLRARGPIQRFDSISLATAKAVASRSLVRLSHIQDRHPYTAFIPEDWFPHFQAIDLLCGDRTEDWRGCRARSLEGVRADLAHRVVIIAERSASDEHESPVGKVQGYVLHANYIESLLDDRFLLPVSPWLEVLAIIVWLGIVESVFRHYEGRPERALLANLGLAALAILLVHFVFITQLGRYLAAWPGSLLVIAGRYATLRFSSIEQALRRRFQPKRETEGEPE